MKTKQTAKDPARFLSIGDRLWNGVIADADLVQRYAAAQATVDAWESTGRDAPEHVLNARHKILRDAI